MQWRIKFFPDKGDRDSPLDFMERFCNAKEQAIIIDKLDRIARVSAEHWKEVAIIKPIKIKSSYKLHQLTVGDFRIYLGSDNERLLIVVSHICRKDAQKAKQKNLDRARLNLEEFFRDYEGGNQNDKRTQ